MGLIVIFLEGINDLSVPGNYSLRINLEDFDGNQRYAEYKNFKVADEKVLLIDGC